MNTKVVLSAAAVALGVAGVALTFAPDELGSYLAFGDGAIPLQLLGAAFFAFAMMNWMSKANLIGGIYGRPLAIGNLTHFAIGGLALIKRAVAPGSPGVLMAIALIYLSFAIVFGYLLFRTPKSVASPSATKTAA
jgi:hypothetical protein